jgi:hypothetical protein
MNFRMNKLHGIGIYDSDIFTIIIQSVQINLSMIQPKMIKLWTFEKKKLSPKNP